MVGLFNTFQTEQEIKYFKFNPDSKLTQQTLIYWASQCELGLKYARLMYVQYVLYLQVLEHSIMLLKMKQRSMIS